MERTKKVNAVKVVAAIAKLFAVLGMAGCVGRNYALELKRIDNAWEASGVSDFLKDPSPYLAVTNDVEKTKAMLVCGAEAASDGARLFGDIASGWFISSKDREAANRNVGRYEEDLCLLLYAHKIVRHSEQQNLGDPDGLLRKEFATDDMNVIVEKLHEERKMYDRMPGLLMRLRGLRKKTTED